MTPKAEALAAFHEWVDARRQRQRIDSADRRQTLDPLAAA